MKKFLKWAAIIIGALIVIAIIVPSKKADSETANTASAEPSATAIKVGENMKTEYFDVKVNSANVNDRVNTGNEFLDVKPEQGNKFLILDVTLKNTDNESRMMFNGELLVDNNGQILKYEQAEPILADGWGMIMDNINPGVTKSTKIVYKIPSDLKGTVYYHPGRADNDEKIELMRL